MSATKLFFVTILLTLLSSASFANTMTLASAQKQINEYRALRKVCTVSILERKQTCFKDLKKLTDKYKQAKLFITINTPIDEEVFVGFAR